MTAKRRDISALPNWPALLSADQAAAYLGMSRNSFEACVAEKRFPGPVDLPIRRRLWQRIGLDAAIAKGSPIADDREARRAAWAKRQDRASATR